jgi:hypothetical protein
MKHWIKSEGRRQQLYTGAAGCGALLWSLAAFAADAETTTVYRYVDANGVVSFSDAPHPAAVPIELTPPPLPLEAEVERANDNYERQLALLEVLEKAHKARVAEDQEQQRLDLDYVRTEAALERARDLQTDYDDDDRYYPIYSPWFWGPHRPNFPHRPPMGRPPMDQPTPPVQPPPQHIQFPHGH